MGFLRQPPKISFLAKIDPTIFKSNGLNLLRKGVLAFVAVQVYFQTAWLCKNATITVVFLISPPRVQKAWVWRCADWVHRTPSALPSVPLNWGTTTKRKYAYITMVFVALRGLHCIKTHSIKDCDNCYPCNEEVGDSGQLQTFRNT